MKADVDRSTDERTDQQSFDELYRSPAELRGTRQRRGGRGDPRDAVRSRLVIPLVACPLRRAVKTCALLRGGIRLEDIFPLSEFPIIIFGIRTGSD